jgi:hypothetical protein
LFLCGVSSHFVPPRFVLSALSVPTRVISGSRGRVARRGETFSFEVTNAVGRSSQHGDRPLSDLRDAQTMTTGTRSVGASAAAVLIGVWFGSAAFAQDSMQLDTMFRESLSQGRDFQAKREDERRRVQGRRYEAREPDQRRDAERRSHQRRSEEGR